MVVRRIAWLAFIGAATPLDTTPSVRKVNRPQHFGLTWLEFPGRDPALWDALGNWPSPTTPGPSRRVHHPIVAPRSALRNTDSATHNPPPELPQHPHNSSPHHPQVPHFSGCRATLVTTPGHPAGRRSWTALKRSPRGLVECGAGAPGARTAGPACVGVRRGCAGVRGSGRSPAAGASPSAPSHAPCVDDDEGPPPANR